MYKTSVDLGLGCRAFGRAALGGIEPCGSLHTSEAHAPFWGSRLRWNQRVSENTDAQHTDLHDNKAVKLKDAFPRLYSNLYFNKGKILD